MLAKELGVDRYELVSALYAIDAYLSKRLSISGSLRVDRDRFAFGRIAGIFPVAEQLEIEVMPKFMSGNEAWRSDFLLLLARTPVSYTHLDVYKRQWQGGSQRFLCQ